MPKDVTPRTNDSSSPVAGGRTEAPMPVDPAAPTKILRRMRSSPYHLGLTGWVILSAFTIVLAVLMRAFVVQTFKIPSESMMPTLLVGDHIIVSRLAYGVYFPGSSTPLIKMGEPHRNDIVVFSKFSEFEDRDSGKHYIKRIVAVPGDSVEVRDFRAYVNGKPVDKGYIIITELDPSAIEAASPDYGPVTLEDGQYFVLGDNRVNSQDSRYYGAINRSDIEGRAWLIYWSWDTTGSYKVRPDRIGNAVR